MEVLACHKCLLHLLGPQDSFWFFVHLQSLLPPLGSKQVPCLDLTFPCLLCAALRETV